MGYVDGKLLHGALSESLESKIFANANEKNNIENSVQLSNCESKKKS